MSRKERGVTLFELLVAVSVFFIAGTVAVVTLTPAFNDARINGAYDSVLMLMRQTRESAIENRKTYILTFNPAGRPPGTNQVTLQRIDNGIATAVLQTVQLPSDVSFVALPGIPNTNAGAPDQMGSGGSAIQFDIGVNGGAANQIYFLPDGSAKDINNNINNGVVYVARGTDLYSSRAITLFGVSGRARGWRLTPATAGPPHWSQQ